MMKKAFKIGFIEAAPSGGEAKALGIRDWYAIPHKDEVIFDFGAQWRVVLVLHRIVDGVIQVMLTKLEVPE